MRSSVPSQFQSRDSHALYCAAANLWEEPAMGNRGGKDIHHAVYDFAHDDRAFAAAALCQRDQGFDQRPLFIGQVAWMAKLAAVIEISALECPHRCPPANRISARESQPIQCLQHVFGRTLRVKKEPSVQSMFPSLCSSTAPQSELRFNPVPKCFCVLGL